MHFFDSEMDPSRPSSDWLSLGLDIGNLILCCGNFSSISSAIFVLYKYWKKNLKMTGTVRNGIFIFKIRFLIGNTEKQYVNFILNLL